MIWLFLCGLCLSVTGLAAILQAIGAPWALTVFSPPPHLLLPLGFPCLAAGVLCIWVVWRTNIRIRSRWSTYAAQASERCARYQAGDFESPAPQRPMPVSDKCIDFTTMRPVDPESCEAILDDRFPESICELLSSCGEDRCYLGRADAIVFDARERRERAELLRDVWVIDRSWSDGRWTTEWLYVGKNGQRLRLAGGGVATGQIDGQPRLSPYWCLMAVNMVGVCMASYFGICIGFVWIPIFMCLAWYAPAWFPVPLRASLTDLNDHCLPGAGIARSAQVPSDQAALRDRVSAVLDKMHLMEL